MRGVVIFFILVAVVVGGTIAHLLGVADDMAPEPAPTTVPVDVQIPR